jgi:uncharacterized protein (TIGR04255 family)
MPSPNPLPRFRKPPLVEVVLAVAFDPIEGLSAPQLGRLWTTSFADLSRVEEQLPYVPPTEVFGPATPGLQIRFQVMPQPPPSRLWFVNPRGTELVQVQRDWFARNWRKRGADDEYLHYDSVRAPFESNLRALADFVENNGLGTLIPRQCEVTYVNQIVRAGVWQNFGDLQQVVNVWTGPPEPGFLPSPEDAGFQARYVMHDGNQEPIGRLHVSLQPAYHQPDGEPIFVLNLTARGAPLSPDLEGVYRFLDTGHEWVVRGFTDLTTSRMHEVWERYV